jgi:hypothetical protein
VSILGEQQIQSPDLAFGEQTGAGVLRPPSLVERVVLQAALGRDVDDVLAALEESLGEWVAGAVAALDSSDPVGPAARVLPHRCVAGLVGGEATRAEQLLVLVDDLDRG